MDFKETLSFIDRNGIDLYIVQELRPHREIDNYSSIRARHDGIFITFWRKYITEGGIERSKICDAELYEAIEHNIDGDYNGVFAVFDLLRMVHYASNRTIFYEHATQNMKVIYTDDVSSIKFNIWIPDHYDRSAQQKVAIKDVTPSLMNKFKIKFSSKTVKMGDIEICRQTLLNEISEMGWYLDVDVTYGDE